MGSSFFVSIAAASKIVLLTVSAGQALPADTTFITCKTSGTTFDFGNVIQLQDGEILSRRREIGKDEDSWRLAFSRSSDPVYFWEDTKPAFQAFEGCHVGDIGATCKHGADVDTGFNELIADGYYLHVNRRTGEFIKSEVSGAGSVSNLRLYVRGGRCDSGPDPRLEKK